MYTEFSGHSEFGPLMTRMQVIDANGDSKMDEEQWEAASESDVVYHKRLADIATRHLHWIHFRKTIVVSSLASLFCSFRFAFCSCYLLHSLLYIFITLRIIGHRSPPLVRRVMTFHTHVRVGAPRHFFQVVWIESVTRRIAPPCSRDTNSGHSITMEVQV
jgi:hypothetical protein